MGGERDQPSENKGWLMRTGSSPVGGGGHAGCGHTDDPWIRLRGRPYSAHSRKYEALCRWRCVSLRASGRADGWRRGSMGLPERGRGVIRSSCLRRVGRTVYVRCRKCILRSITAGARREGARRSYARFDAGGFRGPSGLFRALLLLLLFV